jgi:hypothetical protein
LRPELASWGPKQRYYKPPVVLVLDRAAQTPGHLLVAQTYFEPSLMGPDDVPLGGGRFAESWNVYTLHREFLGQRLAAPPGDLAGKVREAAEGPLHHPPAGSLLFLFRQLELELGCFYAAAAVWRLMEEQEAPEFRAADPAAPEDGQERPGVLAGLAPRGELARELQAMGLALPADWPERAAADLFLLAAPAGERQRLAAAAPEEAGWELPVRLFWLRDGKPVNHARAEATVTDYMGFPKVMVGGRIGGECPADPQWQAMFRWVGEDGRLLASQASSLRRLPTGELGFWAVFPVEGPPRPNVPLQLRLSLFTTQNG